MITELKDLELAVKLAQKELDKAVKAVEDFKSLPENNVFETLEAAEGTIYELLEDRASQACEGSYCCGENYYEQLFYVGDVLYKGIASVEYNRHDKTYYYVDSFDFRIEKVDV